MKKNEGLLQKTPARHCEQSEAIQGSEFAGLLREKHPRNDGSMSFATAPF